MDIYDFLILSSKYILMIITVEFLCAQSPSSMKGLLFGLLFGFIGVSAVINYAWLLPFKLAIKNSPVSSHIGCIANCIEEEKEKKMKRVKDFECGVLFLNLMVLSIDL